MKWRALDNVMSCDCVEQINCEGRNMRKVICDLNNYKNIV